MADSPKRFGKYSEFQFKKYAPSEYKSFENCGGVAGIWLLVCVVSLYFANITFASVAAVLAIPAVVFAVIYWHIANAAVKRAMEGEEMEQADLRKKMASEIANLKTIGNTVIASGGSNVVIGDRNTVTFLQNLEKTDPALDEAVKLITGIVEKSGNKEASESWNDFLEELSGSKKKSKLANAWNGIVRLLPDIATFSESVAKITAIFA